MIRWLTTWEKPAYYSDIYRVVPRMVLLACGLMTWRVTDWFMALDDPGVAQATFVSVVYGVIPLILNFYMQNGVDWDKRRLPPAAPAQPVTVTASATTGKDPTKSE